MLRGCAALVALTGCHSASSPAPASAQRAGDASVVAEYDVAYDGTADLRVEARVRSAGPLTIEPGTERFAVDIETRSAESASWSKTTYAALSSGGCGKGGCLLRYRFNLREAARAIDDVDIASEEGVSLEAPPSTWLIAPREHAGGLVRFRVSATNGTSFATGIFHSATAAGAWDIAASDLWTSPYSVFGPLRRQRLDVSGGARIELVTLAGSLALTDADLKGWTERAASATSTYFGRFPMRETLVIVVPSSGRWIGMGKTLSGGGGAILVRVGERASRRALAEDWVLVHEMVHLAHPSVPRESTWAEEGLATYVEPFARTRAGLEGPEDAWRGLVRGLPQGLPHTGDRGLDHTPTWGRTYWGGALFYLLADIELRKRTNGAKGLPEVLSAIVARGVNNTFRWSTEELFRAADDAAGTPVLSDLHREMGASPRTVDLARIFGELGLVVEGRNVRFDDNAPLAAIRRGIDGSTLRPAESSSAPSPRIAP